MLKYIAKSAIAASCLSLSVLVGTFSADAGETKVAVAANFTAAIKEIGAAFTKETGHIAKFSFGSTGKLYTQIANGAPFSLFLAADQKRPIKAENEDLAVAGTRFTYAKGKIVLYSTDGVLVDDKGAVLREPDKFRKMAVANPKTAPYGTAAMEALAKLKAPQETLDKIVQGDSISQTHQFVASGNAQLGFVALSQVIADKEGSRWIVPDALYAPIKQDVVLLRTGEKDEAAIAFLAFLKGDKAKSIIRSYGYGVE